MDFAALLSVVQTLLLALQCTKLKKICSILGKESELDYLSNTICAVRDVLLNAKTKQELPREALVLLEELKDAVYDADDLLDEFVVLADQNQLMEDGTVSQKVGLFFSCFNPLAIADNMSQEVKKIREKLDVIASDQSQLEFSVDHVPIRRREDLSSDVYADDVVGREDDVKEIVDMLLDPTVQQDVSFLSVVGTRGVGKTALARVVYNDERIERAFPLRLWACVSDQEQKEFDVNKILGKIVRSATNQEYNDSEMSHIHDQLMELLEGRKYLLVLDDLWTENHVQWLKLVEVLMAGRRGSWILVTTRSRQTAGVVGSMPTYELEGLSEENSWRLFKRMAFDQTATPTDDLVKIGQKICKVFDNIPLAVRVIASLLYGQEKSVWLSLLETVLAKIRQGESGIVPILKLSYNHLEPALQSCFSFCAFFPKDLEIYKDFLISLWISQGLIVPSVESQSIEDAGEEFFAILLQRCFFDDMKKDEYGEIVSCKMNNLIHDIAQEIADREIAAVTTVTDKLHRPAHHLYETKSRSADDSFTTQNHIRTYFQFDKIDQLCMAQLVENCTRLRTLVLRDSGIKTLPESIDNLPHLRSLDLSYNSSLEVLPDSITNLHHLQTLMLKSCIYLKTLPRDLNRLVKLRVLDVTYCYRLTHFPSGLGKLTCLHTLSDFVVCVRSSTEYLDQLEGLKALENLRGHLWIRILFRRNAEYVKEHNRGAYLRSKEHLKHVRLHIEHSQGDEGGDSEVALLEDLQPHANLRGLVLFGYRSKSMPSWAVEDNLATFLPNLVRLQFTNCWKLQHLPCLEKLHHLKVLWISDMPNLEYVENNPAVSEPGSSAAGQLFFPCLEELHLFRLQKLKGWRGVVAMEDDKSVNKSRRKGKPKRKQHLSPSLLCLPSLKSFQVRECLELATEIWCPRVKEITLSMFNKKLKVDMISKADATFSASYPSSSQSAETPTHSRLQSIITDNIAWFISLPTDSFQHLTHICIYWDKELENLSEVEEIFRSCSSSLKSLTICHCPRLQSISKGLKYLTVLETLVLEYIANLDLASSKEEVGDGMPWRSLQQSLRSLELKSLPKLVNLPKGMQYLTSLRTLKIWDCEELKPPPKWVNKLKSLKKLEVHGLCDTQHSDSE